MVYKEDGLFKRDIKQRGKNKVTQIRITGIGVNSQFEDNEEIVILRKKDFSNLENQLNSSTEKISDLEKELDAVKDGTTEPSTYTSKVIELQDLINNRNGLLMNTQNTINHIINEVTREYNKLTSDVSTANQKTKENIISLVNELQNINSTILEYNKELENQIQAINTSIDSTSWFTWIRSKSKFKIVLDLDKLQELEAQLKEFNSIDTIKRANDVIKPVEVKPLTIDDLDLTELYISTDGGGEDNIIDTPVSLNQNKTETKQNR